MDDALERYERMKTATAPMARQWVQGFEEGWAAAADRYLMSNRSEPLDTDNSADWGSAA